MRALILTSILFCVPLAHAAEVYVVKGTVLTLLLDHEVEAKKVKKGKTIKTHLAERIAGQDGQVILPAGSEVKGRVEDADERHLTLKFREIKTPFGKKSIEAKVVSVDAENVKLDKNELESPGRSGAKKAASVGTTAAGIATGGVTGVAVKGVGGILFGHGGKELKLKKGTQLKIELKKELKIKLDDS